MAKPILNKIIPYDATQNKIISFSWSGNQVYSNRLIIYDANTLAIVYDKTVQGMVYNHTVTGNSLTNNRNWIVQAQVFDSEGIESELSDKVLFSTFSIPEFYFYGLQSGQTLETASYDAIIYYFQEKYEQIQSYRFSLYDANKGLLQESEILYDQNNIKYTYRSLANHTKYYLRCYGNTVNGMEIDTGYIEVTTNYQTPSLYSILYAENDASNGCIKLNTRIIVIECDEKKINKEYIFENGMIDLRNDSIHYSEGFNIEDDFTLILRGMYLNQTATILGLSNTIDTITVSSYLYDDGQTRFKLTVPNPLSNYILYSDAYSINETDMVGVWIRRINNIYKIKVFVDEDFSLVNNIWYGRQPPANPETYDIWINTDNLFTYVVDKNTMQIFTTDDIPEDITLNVGDLWFGGGES